MLPLMSGFVFSLEGGSCAPSWSTSCTLDWLLLALHFCLLASAIVLYIYNIYEQLS